MSISAMILEPQNDYEEKFLIPIATESFFKEYWIPAIEFLDLKWTKLFATGIDLEADDLAIVISELCQIKIWAEENIDKIPKAKIIDRIEILKNKLPQAYERKGVIVFIG